MKNAPGFQPGAKSTLLISWCNAQQPENGLFFVAPVTPRVNPDRRQLASLAPPLNRQGGNSEQICYFADCQQVRQIIDIEPTGVVSSASPFIFRNLPIRVNIADGGHSRFAHESFLNLPWYQGNF